MPTPIFKNLDRSWTILAVYTPPSIGLITVIVIYYLNLSDPKWAFLASTLTVVSSVWSVTFLSSQSLRKVAQHSDETQWAVKKHLHAIPIGSPEKALNYVISRMPALREVKNTSFNIKNASIADRKFYSKPSYRALRDTMASLSGSGLVWTDIGDQSAIERFRDIYRACDSHYGQDQRYAYFILPDLCPHMNFIILYYDDDFSQDTDFSSKGAEVLFNWDFRSNEGDPVVYSSTDRELVSMFSVHFNTMLNYSAADHDSEEDEGAM